VRPHSLYFVGFWCRHRQPYQEVEGISYGCILSCPVLINAERHHAVDSRNASFGNLYSQVYRHGVRAFNLRQLTYRNCCDNVGAAATKALFIGLMLLITAFFLCRYTIQHPFWIGDLSVLTCIAGFVDGTSSSVFGSNFEQLQLVRFAVVDALGFSLGVILFDSPLLPPVWQVDLSHFQPRGYLILGLSAGHSSDRQCPIVTPQLVPLQALRRCVWR